jgi:hypothetical protein
VFPRSSAWAMPVTNRAIKLRKRNFMAELR